MLAAQYKGTAQSGLLRRYSESTYWLVQSTSDDHNLPLILDVSHTTPQNGVSTVNANISALAGVYQALLTYTTEPAPGGSGEWRTQEMTLQSGTTYAATLGLAGNTDYFIQVIDRAGNVSRAVNGNNYYRIPHSGPPVTLTPTATRTPSVTHTPTTTPTPTATATPARPTTHTVSLPEAGWNLIALPAGPPAAVTAAGLCAALDSQNGASTAVEVVRWEAGGWDAHRCGVPANAFTLQLGRGYFVRVSHLGVSWTYSGTAPSGPVPLQLAAGWNLVGLPGRSANYDAPGLLSSINGAGASTIAHEAARWTNGGWENHLRGNSANAFALAETRAYFVKLSQPATWTP
jgi:hypothetical protein